MCKRFVAYGAVRTEAEKGNTLRFAFSTLRFAFCVLRFVFCALRALFLRFALYFYVLRLAKMGVGGGDKTTCSGDMASKVEAKVCV